MLHVHRVWQAAYGQGSLNIPSLRLFLIEVIGQTVEGLGRLHHNQTNQAAELLAAITR